MTRLTASALSRGIVGSVAATALLIAAVPSSAGGGTHTVSFESPFVDEGTRIDGIGACGPTRTGGCELKISGDATFTGALTTQVDYHGYGHFDPAVMNLQGETWDHHTGNLKGCGDGSFVMHQTDLDIQWAKADPATGSVPMTTKWVILRGSGTGAFTGATGGGTALVHIRPDLSNYGSYKGTITCRNR